MNAEYWESIPRWVVMWGVAFALFVTAKAITFAQRSVRHASRARNGAYLLAWPGMDADAFLTSTDVRPPHVREWCWACAKFAAGLMMLVVLVPALSDASELLAGWVGMSAPLGHAPFRIVSRLVVSVAQRGVRRPPDHGLPARLAIVGRILGPTLEPRLPRLDESVAVPAVGATRRARPRAHGRLRLQRLGS